MLKSLCDNKFMLPLCYRDGGNLMTPLEKFLHDVGEIHSSHSAVDETPYYGSLEVLLNEIGNSLQAPSALHHPPQRTREQAYLMVVFLPPSKFDKKSGEKPKNGQLPSRGAMEVKPPSEDAVTLAPSRSSDPLCHALSAGVGHQFAPVRSRWSWHRDGHAVILEKYELANNEANFWKMTVRPKMYDEVHGPRLTEYLRRVMLHAAPLAAPEDVAPFPRVLCARCSLSDWLSRFARIGLSSQSTRRSPRNSVRRRQG